MTQEQKVIKELLDKNCVSRNWALQNFISRLGAIACNLNKEGWELQGEWVKKGNSRDFVYYVKKMPFKKTQYFVPQLNKVITKYI